MFKKYLTLTLLVLMMNLFFSLLVFAQTQNGSDSRLVLNVKNTVANVGTEPNRKLKVRLKDGTKLKGYITEIKDDHFALLDDKSGKVVQVDYSQVIEAKRDGLSRFAKSLIGGGIAMGAIFIPIFIAVASARD